MPIRFAKTIQATTLQCALMFLVGCGGGGSNSPPNNPAPPPINQSPVGMFTMNPAQGAAPLEIQFDAGTSNDVDGSITNYQWDFGDPPGGSPGINPVAAYTYVNPGTYTVELTVTDDAGAMDTTTNTITISAPGATSTLSGSIRVLSTSAIDSDVNDIGSTVVSNNEFATAQPLPNPVVLGGFANLPMTGVGDEPERGNLYNSGDPADFFALSMAGNEVVTLRIADADAAELELFLYDDQQILLDADGGPDATQVVAVPGPGTYFVAVLPTRGASNYVLTVGQDLAGAANRQPRLSDPFAPGEILVTADGVALGSEYDLRHLAQSGPVSLMGIPDAAAALRALGRAIPTGGTWSPEQLSKHATLSMIQALKADPRVRCAEPNYLRYAQAEPNDPLYGSQWHYPAINLPLAWDITTGSPDPGNPEVIVAVVDTGILANHPDLDAQLVPGYDFISDPNRARDGDGIDPDPTDNGDLSFTGNSSFHGTHVAGTVSAESDNAQGVAGVAWSARIMPVRVLGVDGGTSYDMIQGIRFAAGLSNDSDTTPSQPADIINLSLGSTFSSQSEQDTINEVRDAGVIVIASAGNDATTLPSYPASYSAVTSVSATTINNTLAPYSNTGATVDVAAPGGDAITDVNGDGIGDGVVSTLGDDSNATLDFGYAALQGTSMAAPHVAGVAALMKAVHPGLTPADFQNSLLAGDLTDDLGTSGRDDQFGSGLINAHKAVLRAFGLAAGQDSDPGPILSLSTSALNFGVALDSQPLSLNNAGTGTVALQGITSSAQWLSVFPEVVDAGGMGGYGVRVVRDGLPDGSYNATLSIDTDSNDAKVAVTMRVFSGTTAADAGVHYVIVVDENSETTGFAVSQPINGEYAYTITDVPPGQYRIFAGTDSDDDAFLCDAGEACGAYRTLDTPDTLLINGENMIGLDFISEFRVNFSRANIHAATSNPASPGIRINKRP